MIYAVLNNSRSGKIVKKIFKEFSSFKNRLGIIYKNSRLSKGIEVCKNESAKYLNQSFFKDIIHKKNGNVVSIGNSRAVNLTVYFVKRAKGRFFIYLENSEILRLTNQLRADIHSEPLKTAGTIVFVATLTNVAIVVATGTRIGPGGWFARALFAFLSFGCLFTDVKWDEIKRTGFLTRFLNKNKKV